MDESMKTYQLALALATGVGTVTARKLIKETGSVSAIFQEKSATLLKIKGIGEKMVKAIHEPAIIKRAEKEIGFMQTNGVQMTFIMDPDYPDSLRHCPDAPLVLFYKGHLPAHMTHSISIIGTREPTNHGRELTVRWIKELAAAIPDLYIISGLAYGIDITAHEAALVNQAVTMGVLGHGFHTLYPSTHRRVAEKMLEKGALISDFFSYNIREPKNFIRRNRIIAGITEATLVIESRLKGGAMATAEMAYTYNRELMAVPGRPDDKQSAGCNYLIKSHQASLVSQPADLIKLLGWHTQKPSRSSDAEINRRSDLSNSQREILDLLKKEELNINELGILVRKHPAGLTGDLLTLEFGGYIQASPGGIFKAI